LRSARSLILALLMLGLASCVKSQRVDGDPPKPTSGTASEAASEGSPEPDGLAAGEAAAEGGADPQDHVAPEAAPEATLDPQHIAEVSQQRRSDIRACYEAGVRKNPLLEGRVTYRFVVASAGEVERVDVEQTTLGSPAVLKCISRLIEGLRFDPPEGGGSTVVRYPFHFQIGRASCRERVYIFEV